ncbi:hypothetical protein BN1805_04085 [Proteus vulgaris]|nr:hypothetical protein BN1805_04085 [Proteus vulgaris]
MAWNKESIKQIPKPAPFIYLKWLLSIGSAIFFSDIFFKL